MKKLVVLTLLLAMASWAAATLQLSVNGDPNPVDSQIVLAPSEHLVLDVYTDVTLPFTGAYLLVMADAAQGVLAGGAPTQGGLSSNLNDYAMYFAEMAGRTNVSAVAGNVSDVTATFSGKIYDLIDFHCIAPGETLIQLYGSNNGADWVLQDSLIIHQGIPEPMTMVLLGLGGLLLRKR